MRWIVELGIVDVDRVAPLFKQLVAFHREVVEGAWPVRSEASPLRRAGRGWVRA
ncbi:MAG TPA: hypothetical protein VFU16_05255 [Solirubrobacterales bacterium]|nr:hypothetical protein [Solirubrobacterales bacterium]